MVVGLGLSVVVVGMELLSLEVVLGDVVVGVGLVAVSEGAEVLVGEEDGFDVVGMDVEGAVVDGAVELFSPPPPRQPLATDIPIISATSMRVATFLMGIPSSPARNESGCIRACIIELARSKY